MLKKFVYSYLPLITLVYIVINLYLVQSGSPLCQSSGCQATKTVLSVDSTILYYMGILGSLFVFFSGSLYHKTEGGLDTKKFFLLGLVSMVIAETIFLYYLVLKTNDICITCSIFYGLLVLNLFLYSIVDKKIIFNPIVYIVPAVLSMTLLDIRNQPELLNQGYTLIGSKDCKYCKETKLELDALNVNYDNQDYTNYSGLFKAFNIKTIPVLIVNQGSTIKTIVGKDNILKNFKNTSTSAELEEVPLLNDFSSILGGPMNQEGCTIETLTKGEDCEK